MIDEESWAATNADPNDRLRLEDYCAEYGGTFRHPRRSDARALRRLRLRAAVTIARYYASRIRDTATPLTGTRHDVVLTGTTSSGRRLTLRPPRIADAPAWRAIRLRDRAVIEPYWVTAPQDWHERHTDPMWIRQTMTARADARAGNLVHTVIDIDGHFAGQCDLWMDRFHRRGELSIWVDSRLAGQGVAAAAARALLGYAFTELGLVRITAPVDLDNARSERLVERLGMTREGTMTSYMSVGGRRRDHDLWAITADMWNAPRRFEGRIDPHTTFDVEDIGDLLHGVHAFVVEALRLLGPALRAEFGTSTTEPSADPCCGETLAGIGDHVHGLALSDDDHSSG